MALLISWLTACGPNADRQDAVAYQAEMGPILQKNKALAQDLLETASEIKKGTADGTAVATRVRQRVIPQADQLKASAEGVHPATVEFQLAHATLVRAWTERAEAWRAVADAWDKGDVAALEAARSRDLASKKEEDVWLVAVGTLMTPHGLTLAMYPKER